MHHSGTPGISPSHNPGLGSNPYGNIPSFNLQQQGQQRQPQRFRQPLPRAYCWTHGWCAHNGYDCTSPAAGHIPQATLQNRMGGSNKNCT